MPLYKITFEGKHEYFLADDWQLAVEKWAEKGTANFHSRRMEDN